MCEGGEDQTNKKRETLFVWTHPNTGASEVKTPFSAKRTTNGLLRKDCTVCELESKAARKVTHHVGLLTENLAKGYSSPWLTWRSLNRLRTGYTCSKEQRKKWKYYDGDTTCVYMWTSNRKHGTLVAMLTLDTSLQFG